MISRLHIPSRSVPRISRQLSWCGIPEHRISISRPCSTLISESTYEISSCVRGAREETRVLIFGVCNRISPKSPSPGSKKHHSRTKSKERTTSRLRASPSASAPRSTAFTPPPQNSQSPYPRTGKVDSRSHAICCRMSWCGTRGSRNQKAWPILGPRAPTRI